MQISFFSAFLNSSNNIAFLDKIKKRRTKCYLKNIARGIEYTREYIVYVRDYVFTALLAYIAFWPCALLFKPLAKQESFCNRWTVCERLQPPDDPSGPPARKRRDKSRVIAKYRCMQSSPIPLAYQIESLHQAM